MFIMDITSDSDDSAFLFSTNLPKRKAGCNVGNKLKKLRLASNDQSKLIDEVSNEIEAEEQKGNENSLQNSIHADCTEAGNELYPPMVKVDMLISDEKNAGHEDVEGKKFMSEVLENYFSCPLCLKTFRSETTHFTHMKQCAKKSKMSAKQLLEALQLHKQHLKERISAGVPNIPTKKKKIQVSHKNTDSAFQLAVALALSKSLEDVNVTGKENQTFTDSNCVHRSNKTTLEKFGFTLTGKNYNGIGKKSKNWKLTHSVLKERTNEEREKLLTEKASVVLLINDDTMISEAKESLRIYHCKLLEQARNKDSHLWKLGEKIEESDWYVEELKNIILEEKVEEEEKIDYVKMCNIDEEIMKLRLPKTKIFEDWRRLVNNKHLSDLSLNTKDGEIVHLHSVVLYARYEKLFDMDLKNVFNKFESCTVLNLLQYLYCGTLNGLTQGELENLFNLAQSVCYQELVEILTSLKQSLKKNNENVNDRDHSEINYSPEWRKLLSSPPKVNILCEMESTNCSLEERTSWNDALECKDQTSSNDMEYVEYDEKLSGKDGKTEESEVVEVITNKDVVGEEESRTPENDGCPTADTWNDEETCDVPEKWNACEPSEMDMFEEVENLNETISRNSENDSTPIAKGDPECIEISSGSTKSDAVHGENVEENEKLLSEIDYEIPYFDPYEHFNSDIPETEPFADSEEQNNHSQSLIIGEISPVKSTTPKRPDESYIASPGVSGPGCCSTPNKEVPQPSTSANFQSESIHRECSGVGTMKKIRYGTPCSRINRKSGRLSMKSKLFRSRSAKKSKTGTGSDEVDSEKVADILTESILRELDNSIGSAVGKTPPTEEKNYIEVTPAVPGEEYVENVTPFPDYSVMGASSIKKHLTKYGLKKSLSRNKAKRILRHIYEELHPIVNTKNGKIVKYVQSDKSKKCKRKKVGLKGEKKKGKRESSLLPTGIGESRAEVRWSEPETPTKKRSCGLLHSPRVTPQKSPRNGAEEDAQSWTSIDSCDGTPGSSTPSGGNCFEVEEPLSQGNYSSATYAPMAVYDFILDNEEIHRQILMYEPIWLEQLQRKLFEKYNKKFKLTDLMDCLDAECITFRCESQRRTNNRRK